MAIIYSYPLNQPKRDDLLIGTITYDEDAINPVHGNPTVSFTIGSLLNLVSGQGNIQNLQQVTNIGNTTTNSIVISNNLLVSGGYYDSSNQPGTAGQLLSSTATGTQWVNTAQGVTSLTTNGTSGVSTLVGSVLNIPNYANTQNTLTTTGTGAATLVGTVLNIPTPPTANFTSLTTTGTSGDAATLSVGVLNIPTPVIPFTSLTTTGSGVATLTAGVLNIPDYTYTEIDTLATVTARGASTTVASTFSGGLTSSGVLNVSGSGQDGYLYVSGNAGNPTSTAPTHAQGFAFAYNNSGGSRECEVFWNTGTTTAAINNVSYLGFYNEFLNSDAGNARVTDTQLKLYGTGELELVGATPTISNPYWRMPTTAAPNTGYVLAKANGSINLEWVANGGSIYQTTNITVSAAQLSALNGSPITLLSAPGVGKTYHFNQIFFWFEAGSVVYNFGGMGTGIGFVSVTGLTASSYHLSDMDSASSSMVNQGRNFNYMNIDPATANAAVILTPFQGTNPNPTQGNGILYISISYEIKDLGPTIQAN